MGSKATDYPALLLTGTSWGTIEDCMFGAVVTTTEAMRVKAAYVKDMSGGSVLAVLEKPTVDEPFRSLTVGGSSSTSRCRRRLNRDYVYVEYMDIVQLFNGGRIGCQIYHSVSFPQTGPLPGRVRANMTVTRIFRQLGPDLVEIYGSGIVDPAGDACRAQHGDGLPHGFEVRTLQRDEEDHLDASEAARRAERVWAYTATSGLRDGHLLHLENTKRWAQERGALVQTLWRLFVPLVPCTTIVGVAGFLDQHKVTFCGRCLQQLRQMSPLEIARLGRLQADHLVKIKRCEIVQQSRLVHRSHSPGRPLGLVIHNVVER